MKQAGTRILFYFVFWPYSFPPSISSSQEHLKNKDYDSLQEDARRLQDGAGGVIIIQAKDVEVWKSNIRKHLRQDAQRRLADALKVNPGDVIFVSAGKPDSVVSFVKLRKNVKPKMPRSGRLTSANIKECQKYNIHQ